MKIRTISRKWRGTTKGEKRGPEVFDRPAFSKIARRHGGEGIQDERGGTWRRLSKKPRRGSGAPN